MDYLTQICQVFLYFVFRFIFNLLLKKTLVGLTSEVIDRELTDREYSGKI